MTACTVPAEVSDLLELAVIDAKILDKDDRYRLDMRRWHSPGKASYYATEEVCRVCMAGAVLARECEVPPSARLGASETEILKEMNAIDYMRRGLFHAAGKELGIQIPDEVVAQASGVMGKFNEESARYPWAGYMRAVEVLRENGY